jgi:hypothetical protein
LGSRNNVKSRQRPRGAFQQGKARRPITSSKKPRRRGVP